MKTWSVIFVTITIFVSSYAKTYVTVASGKWNKPSTWIEKPPYQLAQGDTILLNHDVVMNEDLLLNGVLVVNEEAIIRGNGDLVINRPGSMINRGESYLKSLLNRGVVVNYNQLFITTNLLNHGFLYNYALVDVGQMLSNAGVLAGENGGFTVKNKLINRRDGKITGYADMCASHTINENGSSIDSLLISYCGIRIFQRLALAVTPKTGFLQLRLMNIDVNDFEKIEILKSVNGDAYTPAWTIRKDELSNGERDIVLKDLLEVDTDQVRYKMAVTYRDGFVADIQSRELDQLTVHSAIAGRE